MAARLITADTSVVVAGLSGWHEAHAASLAALRGIVRLPAHVLIETTSVLTRLPGGRAIRVHDVVERLLAEFPGEPLSLGPGQHLDLLRSLPGGGVVGGQVYDALVGVSARAADALLRTRDVRAMPVYAALGVEVEQVG